MASTMSMENLEQYAFNEAGTGEQLYSRFNNRTNPYFTHDSFREQHPGPFLREPDDELPGAAVVERAGP
jgi:hypothetical protein